MSAGALGEITTPTPTKFSGKPYVSPVGRRRREDGRKQNAIKYTARNRRFCSYFGRMHRAGGSEIEHGMPQDTRTNATTHVGGGYYHSDWKGGRQAVVFGSAHAFEAPQHWSHASWLPPSSSPPSPSPPFVRVHGASHTREALETTSEICHTCAKFLPPSRPRKRYTPPKPTYSTTIPRVCTRNMCVTIKLLMRWRQGRGRHTRCTKYVLRMGYHRST